MERQCSPLGDFGKLPLEIREMVWREFRPRGIDENYRKVQKSDLRIMRTSKALCAEISRHMFRSYVVFLDIYPESDITLRDNGGAKWMFKGEEEFRARGFGLFPWHKVDICIDLNAVGDPVSSNAEFCLFWKRTYGFVQTLKEASSLRRVIVSFWYHKGNDWNITGIPRHTHQPSWKQISGRIYSFERHLQHFNICYPHQIFILLFLTLSHTSKELQFNHVPDNSPDLDLPDLVNWFNTSNHTRSFTRDYNQWLTQTHQAFEKNLEIWMWARAQTITFWMGRYYSDLPIDLDHQIIFAMRERPDLVYKSDNQLSNILGPILWG